MIGLNWLRYVQRVYRAAYADRRQRYNSAFRDGLPSLAPGIYEPALTFYYQVLDQVQPLVAKMRRAAMLVRIHIATGSDLLIDEPQPLERCYYLRYVAPQQPFRVDVPSRLRVFVAPTAAEATLPLVIDE